MTSAASTVLPSAETPNPRGASKSTGVGDLASLVGTQALQLRDSAGLSPASPFSPAIRDMGTLADVNVGT
jgi:hypothetical protein